jgi:F420-dependent oxidoreductase-like protein
VVGEAEDDVAASDDAFAVLDAIVAARLRRRLTTVVDTLGLDRERRARWLELARANDVPAVAVVFPTPFEVCRERTRARTRPLPESLIHGHLRRLAEQRGGLAGEGFEAVYEPVALRTVPARLGGTSSAAARQQQRPVALRFGLHLSSFAWEGGSAALRERLARYAAEAEAAGFESLWLMDHFRQIPQVGREWEDLPECFTTLGYLAAATTAVRLGSLVAAVTHRNVGLLAKMVATLDVLSGGRAVCGLGIGWHEAEARAYGLAFPPRSERYAVLEDALQALPLLWGKGAPAFAGRALQIPEAMCYPRPLQARVALLVGGSGERRTLRLVARYADGTNLFGDAATVRRKLEVLHAHCAEAGRDPAAIEVTHLSTALAAPTADAAAELAARLRPGRASPARFAASVNAAGVEDHVGRFRTLAEAGVQTAIVRLADLGRDPGAIERFAPVIASFS